MSFGIEKHDYMLNECILLLGKWRWCDQTPNQRHRMDSSGGFKDFRTAPVLWQSYPRNGTRTSSTIRIRMSWQQLGKFLCLFCKISNLSNFWAASAIKNTFLTFVAFLYLPQKTKHISDFYDVSTFSPQKKKPFLYVTNFLTFLQLPQKMKKKKC